MEQMQDLRDAEQTGRARLSTRWTGSSDLLLASGAAVAMVLISNFLSDESVLRAIFGLAYLQLVPGYTVIAAMFPERDALDTIERIGFSLAVGAAVTSVLTLTLDLPFLGIRQTPLVAMLCLEALAASLLAHLRRMRIPATRRFSPGIRLELPSLQGINRLDRFLLGVTVLSCLGMLLAVGYAFVVPAPLEPFTEFYVVGAEGVLGDMAREVEAGQTVQVALIVVSHEAEEQGFWIQMQRGEYVQPVAALELAPGERWSLAYSFDQPDADQHTRVSFRLFKAGEDAVYRSLDFRLGILDEGLIE